MDNRLDATTDQQKQILTFIDLALVFNKKHNIFRRKNKEEVYINDVLECAQVLKAMKKNEKKILDLGSGGGFPGMVLAILKPKTEITLAEKNQKKAYFLEKTIKKLGLKNCNVKKTNITKNTKLEPFDAITTRAFSSIKKTIQITQNLAHKSTTYYFFKGKEAQIQKEVAEIDLKSYTVKIFNTKKQQKERNIVIVNKNE